MRRKIRCLAPLILIFMAVLSLPVFAQTDMSVGVGDGNVSVDESQLMSSDDVKLHGWISKSDFGENYENDTYYLTETLYYMYRLEDEYGNKSSLIGTLGTYTVTISVYCPDGTLLSEKTFTNTVEGSLAVEYKQDYSMFPGLYTCKIVLEGPRSGEMDLGCNVEYKRYTVTYDPNGGESVEYTSCRVLAGETANLYFLAQREGWTHIGWNTDKNATSRLYSYEVNSDATLYAIYQKTIDIQFISCNNVLQKSISKTVYGCQPWVRFDVPTPDAMEGWETRGWRTDNLAEEPTLIADTCTDSTTFYAVYKKDVVLGYDSNGGSEAPESQSDVKYFNAGGNLDVPTFTVGPAVTKNGCTFKGWEIEGTVYAPGSSVTLYSSQTATAVWEEKNYTVTYNYSYNGGSSASKNTDLVLQGSYADLSVTAVKEGWVFIGWNTDKTATTKLSSYVVTGDVELYAIYKKVMTVSFYYGNKSLQTTTTVTIYNNSTYGNVTMPAPGEYSGWTTEGWVANNDILYKQYGEGQSVRVSGDLDFYGLYYRTITLSYNANGGLNTPASSSKTQRYNASGNKQKVNFDLASAITRPGYIFNGWALNSVTGTLYDAETLIPVTDSAIMYATWVAEGYTVTYNYSFNGGGSASKLTAIVANGSNANLSVTAEREGWEFVGWNTNPYSETALTSYTVTYDATLYALFKKDITVKFYSNYNSLQETKTDTIYNRETRAQIMTPNPVAIGNWTAVGWRNDQSVAGHQYDSNDYMYPTESMDVYAIYYRMISLSYNANGGDGAPATKSLLQYMNHMGTMEAKTFTLASAITRSGYAFKGWRLNSASGTLYDADSTIRLTSSATMYADWEGEGCTVTYNYSYNGGSSAGKITDTVTAGNNADLSVTAVKNGWVFAGWNTDKDAQTVLSSYTVSGDVTLYAIYYKVISYEYYSQENKLQITRTSMVYNNDTTILMDAPQINSYDGFTAVGWRDDTLAAEPEYSPLVGFVAPAADTKMYAIYKGDVTLSYNTNGVGDAPASDVGEIYYNAYGTRTSVTFTLPQPPVVQEGVVFQGWYEESNSIIRFYQPGSEHTISEDKVLYGWWRNTFRSVLYNYSYNGGSGASKTSDSVIEGNNADLSVTAEKEGWIFVGWNTDPSAISGLSEYTVTRDVTLYAIYKKEFDIKFYSKENQLQSHSVQAIYNNEEYVTIVTLQPEDMDGWQYDGWRLDKNSQSARFTINEVVFFVKSVTFYAVYKKNINLVYDSNCGDSTPLTQTAKLYYNSAGGAGTAKFTLADEIERSGFKFKGWDINGTVYNAGDVVSCQESLVATAIWEADECSVTYDYSTNGGSSASKTTALVSCGSNADLNATAVKPGWKFVGWNTDENAKEALSNCQVTGDITLYAIFKKDIAVKFYSGENELQKEYTKTMYNKETYTEVVTEQPYDMEGWNKWGWRTDTRCEDRMYEVNQTLQLSADATFYGVYKRVIALEYDREGAPIMGADAQFQYRNSGGGISGVKYTVENGITKNGYTFKGWEIDGTVYNTGDEVVIYESQTARAKWEVVEFTVTYNYSENGGDSVTKTGDVVPYFSLADLSVVATKPGWEFVGWSTDKTATTKQESHVVTGDVTLYAIYKKDITLRFYCGENVLTDTKTETIFNKETSVVCEFSNPSACSGWSAEGWRDDTNCAQAIYFDGDHISVADSTDFYGVYTREIILEYYKCDELPIQRAQQYYNASGSKSMVEFVLASAVSKEGHSFGGWALNSGNGQVLHANSTISVSENTVMYPLWERKIGLYEMSVTQSEGVKTWSFNVELDNAEEEIEEEAFSAYAVSIDGGDNIVGVETSVVDAQGNAVIEVDKNKSVSKVRVFVWDKNMRPVTEKKIVEIE